MIQSLLYTILGINLLAYCMVIVRPKIYGTDLYRPMLLNIKLSLAPLCVLGAIMSLIVILQIFISESFWWLYLILLTIGLIIWVLLLPNAGYLITELNFNHRDHDAVEVPLWYDIISVLTLAMSGVMNMCFNVFMLHFVTEVIFRAIFPDISFIMNRLPGIIMVLLMVLASFGIYLGRYIRFNSWDVKHPVSFVKKLRKHFSAAGSLKNCFLFILFHSLFFIVFYRATVGVVLEELLASMTFLN